MEIVYNKTEAEERTFVQKLVDTAWQTFILWSGRFSGGVVRRLYTNWRLPMGAAKR